MQSFRFPWLLSNVLDATTGEPLGGADRCRLITWQGVRVGLMGLVEREWLLTIPSIEEKASAERGGGMEGLRGELWGRRQAAGRDAQGPPCMPGGSLR